LNSPLSRMMEMAALPGQARLRGRWRTRARQRGPLEGQERPGSQKHVLPAALRHPPDPGARRFRHTDASQAGPKPAADARLDAPDRQSPETRLRRSSNPLRIPAFGPAAKAAGRPDAPESPRKEAGGAFRAGSSPGIPTTAQDRHRSVQPGPVKSQPDRPPDQTRG